MKPALEIQARIERLGRTKVGLARLVGSAGAVLVLSGLALWMLFGSYSFRPASGLAALIVSDRSRRET